MRSIAPSARFVLYSYVSKPVYFFCLVITGTVTVLIRLTETSCLYHAGLADRPSPRASLAVSLVRIHRAGASRHGRDAGRRR